MSKLTVGMTKQQIQSVKETHYYNPTSSTDFAVLFWNRVERSFVLDYQIKNHQCFLNITRQQAYNLVHDLGLIAIED